MVEKVIGTHLAHNFVTTYFLPWNNVGNVEITIV